MVVEPVDESGSEFRIAIANKFGVKPYEPSLSLPPIYKRGEQLREFILTKCKS